MSTLDIRPSVADDANMRDSPSLPGFAKKRGKINVGTATSEEREELPLALAPLVTDEAGRAHGRGRASGLHHSASRRTPMIKKSASWGIRHVEVEERK